MTATTTPAQVRFLEHCVTNGTDKARVWYNLDNRADARKCVTINAKDYGRPLARVFRGMDTVTVENDTDSMTDYFDTDSVTLFEGHALYAAARARAEQVQVKNEARYKEKRMVGVERTIEKRFGPATIEKHGLAKVEQWACERVGVDVEEFRAWKTAKYVTLRATITERVGPCEDELGADAVDMIVAEECAKLNVDPTAFTAWVDERMEEEAGERIAARAAEQAEPSRHDFTPPMREFLNAAIACRCIDAVELVVLGIKFGTDHRAIVRDIIEAAFAARHTSPAMHATLAPLADEVFGEVPHMQAGTIEGAGGLSTADKATAEAEAMSERPAPRMQVTGDPFGMIARARMGSC